MHAFALNFAGMRSDGFIHYLDAHLLVVEKPAGLLSVPGRLPENRDCVVSRLQASHPEVLTVHRLDQVTSGLMLYARGKAMQVALSVLFEQRQVTKRYQALVCGVIDADSGEIALPLTRDWPNRPRQKVDHQTGKPSLTRWWVVERDQANRQTRLELEPVTGRTHQLRVHLASIGHPIIGDVFYGADADVAGRVCLHARRLAFTHPATAQAMAFESPPPF
ncbi:RluA family pseudouridine synthase [Stenotrophomonas sp. YIM B06876]|uniref:RluA family pseudouridine synthase n=1 Tax=Stenotrophomonas sp. YIM B06876 TaxID=3060211 RepID=UPI002739EFB3|nr:RluA family pseudouridine synthase [Stenotrophomonas sp. YIM B06876]